jgi:endoglucanase
LYKLPIKSMDKRWAALAAALIALFLFDVREPGASGSGKVALVGVNLPSATFAEQKIPGQPGVDYFYPNEKDIDYFLNKGMNAVRLGFAWERLQPVLYGSFDHDESKRLDEAVQAIIRRSATVILDLHNYARYRNQTIGSAAVPEDSLADFWIKLATIYRGNDHVIFGLMNEPHDIDASQWQHVAQTAIYRIRQTGARNRILVSSSQWAGASHFLEDEDVWKRFVDPANNFTFEVHQYFDANNTGTQPQCPDTSIGVAAIKSVTQWMQRNRHQVFLGEFGASGQKDCLTALSLALKTMQQQSDVWLGWTYFAGGRGWADNDILSIQPVSKDDKPQMKLLKEYLQ